MRFYTKNKDVFLSECLSYPVYHYSIADQIDTNERAMYQTKLNTFDTNIKIKNSFLIQKGFKLVSVNVLFEKESNESGGCCTYDNLNNSITLYKTEDAQKFTNDILRIAATSFKYNRYYNDERIIIKQADFIMEKQAYSCLYEQQSNVVFLEFEYDKLVGFLFSREHEKHAQIYLIAIDPEYKSKKHGFNLVNNFLYQYSWFSKYRTLQVGTQITNLQAIMLYQKCGFKIKEFNYIYHLHIGV